MNLQKTITNLLLKLPDAVLVAMSGGKPIVRDGRRLDARFQFIEVAASKRPLPNPLTPEFARYGTDLLTELFGGRTEIGVSFDDIHIETAARRIPARAYRPSNQRPAAALMVFFHFGGGVVGNVGTCHAFCSMIAKIVGCPVLSIEYRLAPEHQWPAGLDDAIDAFLWGRDHAAQFGAPEGVAAAGGDSMGGNFTAILAQEMKRRNLAQPLMQLLIYPATDMTDASGSMQTCSEAYPLTKSMLEWFMANYLPNGTDPTDLRISPALSPDLSGLAPAIVVAAGHDPLHDQGLAYAKALQIAGVVTRAKAYNSLAHGFTAYTGAVPDADKACREIARTVLEVYRQNGH
jgi:acetyl esterase